MKNITGIILCGGKSCRFGEDKGLCTLAGKPMIEYPLSALNSICDEILISSNDPRYDNMGYKVIKDNIKNIGPIGGIFSALQQSKTEDNLIVSCDMPFVNEKLLNYILDNKNDHLVAAAFEGQYVEPLCSYYNKKVLPLIEQQIGQKQYKLSKLLEKADYKKIFIDESLNFYKNHLFLNINTRSEYDRAERILGGKFKISD